MPPGRFADRRTFCDNRPVSEPTVVVIHYAEVGLKGGNRRWFEERLRDNVARMLEGSAGGSVKRERGRLVAALDGSDGAEVEEALARVGRVPGVAWFAPARLVPADLEAVTGEAVARAREGRGSFAVATRRADKRFPLNSMEVNRHVGAAIAVATGRPVDLTEPDDTYGIEIADTGAFVFEARRRGIGGLPVGSSGRVVTLLSGGIDSPVAAWRMMTRGCRVLGVHFFNNAFGGEGVLEKLDLLGEALARYQGRFHLKVVPFEDLQRAIVAAVPPDHRMILYRRAMLRLADRIRSREKAKALVTGDSVGQVASQTLDNLAAVYSAVPGPVLAPLCGEDKAATIETARRIGTYEPSILPHQDCCSFLIAPHPVTKAKRAEVEEMEASIEWGTLVEEAMQGVTTRSYGR